MVTEARLFNDITYLDYGVFWVTVCGSHCFGRTCLYLCSGVINHKNIIYVIAKNSECASLQLNFVSVYRMVGV